MSLSQNNTNETSKRDDIFDFLRGLAIFDMILVHYASYFNSIVSKIIIYDDIAMEAFILLSGFIIGKHYFRNFVLNNSLTTKTLVIRAFKILIVQYVLIISVSLPCYILQNEDNSIKEVFFFLLKSFTFYNQIGLIHILPSFVPLFLVSPAILFFLNKDADLLVLSFSFTLFLMGQVNPYIFNYGEKTIFPVILWQIYFVFGCVLGKYSLRKNSNLPERKNTLFLISIIILCTAFGFKYGHLLFPHATIFNGIIFSRFPLNLPGLLFGVSIIFFLYMASVNLWIYIKNHFIVKFISTFGRNSLLVFFIHVYFAKLIIIVKDQTGLFIIYLIIGINILLGYLISKKFEENKSSNKVGIIRFFYWAF